MTTENTITNRIGMKMVLIPAGEFRMGRASWEQNPYTDDGPSHHVRITKPFYMGVYEVTQSQFARVMGKTPWRGRTMTKDGPNHAASYISWKDAVAFCKNLSSEEGRSYRLPTEAQWEYACRAGSETAYCFGDDPSDLAEYGWYDGNVGFDEYAHEVGTKCASAWGLYDMHGNVSEWCSDWYNGSCCQKSPVDDPLGPATGMGRILRGGSWGSDASCSGSAYRFYTSPDDRHPFTGFRVVLLPAD